MPDVLVLRKIRIDPSRHAVLHPPCPCTSGSCDTLLDVYFLCTLSRPPARTFVYGTGRTNPTIPHRVSFHTTPYDTRPCRNIPYLTIPHHAIARSSRGRSASRRRRRREGQTLGWWRWECCRRRSLHEVRRGVTRGQYRTRGEAELRSTQYRQTGRPPAHRNLPWRMCSLCMLPCALCIT